MSNTLIDTIEKQEADWISRKVALKAFLEAICDEITVGATNNAFMIENVLKFDYSAFTKRFELLLKDFSKLCLENNWFNPFLNRHLYNYTRLIPLRMISHLIFEEVFVPLQYQDNISDKTLKLMELDPTKIPFIFKKYEVDTIRDIVEQTNLSFLRDLYPFVSSSEKVGEQFGLACELLVQEFMRTSDSRRFLETEKMKEDDAVLAVANLRFTGLAMQSVLSLPGGLIGYTPKFLRSVSAFNDDLFKEESFFAPPPSEYAQLIDILWYSEKPFELIRAINTLKTKHIGEFNSYVMSNNFQHIRERFVKIVGLEPMLDFSKIYVEQPPELVESIPVSSDGLLATTRSQPLARWIRTLDGEYYVERPEVTEETKPETEVNDPKDHQDLLGLDHPQNELEKQIFFMKTGVGYSSKFDYLKTLSIYGKTDDIEEARRRVEVNYGDLNARQVLGNYDESFDIAVRRDRLGQGTIGNRISANFREILNLEAIEWGERITEQAEHEFCRAYNKLQVRVKSPEETEKEVSSEQPSTESQSETTENPMDKTDETSSPQTGDELRDPVTTDPTGTPGVTP